MSLYADLVLTTEDIRNRSTVRNQEATEMKEVTESSANLRTTSLKLSNVSSDKSEGGYFAAFFFHNHSN